MLRNKFLWLPLLLAGCAGVNGMEGVPTLAENQVQGWLYACKQEGLIVDYARMAGVYSARVQLADETYRVLNQTQNPLDFQLDDLSWFSVDGEHFTLKQGDKVLHQECVARTEIPQDRIALHPNLKLQ